MRRLPLNRQQHKTMTRTKQRADKQRGQLLTCIEQLSHDLQQNTCRSSYAHVPYPNHSI